MRNNGNNKIKEHPKTAIEVIEGTREAVEAYAKAKDLTFTEASQVLILNELRCIHWHFDNDRFARNTQEKVKP